MHSTRLLGAAIAVFAISHSTETLAQSISADAAALVRQGERLAKTKRYNDALLAFKSADKLFPKAEHDCWIGLAYARLQMATQANFYVSRCKQRAGEARPIPWYPKAKILAENMLKLGRYAPISFESLHGGAVIRPETFDEDEWLDLPVKLWMPIGSYAVDAKAPGFEKKQLSVEVTSTRSQKIRVSLKGSKAKAGSNTVRFPSLIKSKSTKPNSADSSAAKEKPTTTKKAAAKATPPPVPKNMPEPKKAEKKTSKPELASKLESQTADDVNEETKTAASEAPPVDMSAKPSAENKPSELATKPKELAAADSSDSLLPILGWTAVGLGLASLGSSVYFYQLGDEAARNADLAFDRDVRSAEIENYQRYSAFTYTAYGIGGGLIATGVGLLIYDLMDDQPKNSGLSLKLIPDVNNSGILVSGNF